MRRSKAFRLRNASIPNCSAIAIVLALRPLLDRARLMRVVISTYQSVSGGGAEALGELEHGVRAGLEGDPPARAGGLPPFAYNVVPQIDRFESDDEFWTGSSRAQEASSARERT